MVFSKLNLNVIYPDTKTVDDTINNAPIKIMKLPLSLSNSNKAIKIPVVFGNIKKTHDLIYFPLYLIKKGDQVEKIGYIEQYISKLINYLTSNNKTYNIDKLINDNNYTLCLFHYVNAEYLITNSAPIDPFYNSTAVEEAATATANALAAQETEDDKKLKKLAYKEDIKTKCDLINAQLEKLKLAPIFTYENAIELVLPPAENATMAKGIKSTFNKNEIMTNSKGYNWVQLYMKNPHYFLYDYTSEMGNAPSNTFYICLLEAFRSIGLYTNIASLKNTLAQLITPEIYNFYKDMYDILTEHYNITMDNIKKERQTYDMIKSRFTNNIEINSDERAKLLNEGRHIENSYKDLLQSKKIQMEFMRNILFMKNVKSLDELKNAITMDIYTPDFVAIYLLELALNIKCIFLLEETYDAQDNKSVVDCNTDTEIVKKDLLFNSVLKQNDTMTSENKRAPYFYVILNNKANYYKLVGYYTVKIFTQYKYLPYDLKKLIVIKCGEYSSSEYLDIQDFYRTRELLKMQRGQFRTNTTDDDIDLNFIGGGGAIYDKNIALVFYSKAADKLPGKGLGEKIPTNKIIDFIGLAKFANWRKILDNDWCNPKGLFTLNNKKWASVEHYYQANKFTKYQQFYLSFTLESETELSKNVAMAKAAGSASGLYKKKILLRPEQIKIDPEFYSDKERTILEKAIFAKFSQNIMYGLILINTRKAGLYHYMPNKSLKLATVLMVVRQKIDKVTGGLSSSASAVS